jgi:hypothetical protein
LRHIVNTQWENFFFNNSDMLTLPLVQQSIALKEPFHLVFSSQIFLFPESILYVFSSLITPDFRWAIIVNAFLNCVLLYALFRWIAGLFVPVVVARLYSLGATLFFIFLCWLEPETTINIATPFLATTVYYGVILCSLASIALTTIFIRRLDNHPWKSLVRRNARVLAGLFVIATLVILSNPLYLFQFVAPLAAVCMLAWLINVMSFRNALLILAPQLAGAVVGMAARTLFFRSFFSPSGGIGNYLHFKLIGAAARTLKDNALLLWHGSWQEKLELILIVFGVTAALVVLLAVIHVATKPKPNRLPKISLDLFLLAGLGALTPLLVLIGSVLTGNPVPRYLIPIIIFPLLSLLFLISFLKFRKRDLRVARLGLVAVAGILLLLGIASNPVHSIKGVTNYDTADQQCLDDFLGKTPYKTGVAQYWRARGLQLNSRAHLKVLQVEGQLTRFTWLYNSSAYKVYTPNFVVVDRVPVPSYDANISVDDFFAIKGSTVTAVLGEPANIYSCPSFEIYTYPNNTPAPNVLKKRLQNTSLGL